MKRCLITGCEGFIGALLADFLVKKGYPVYGIVYGDTARLSKLGFEVCLFKCDLKDRKRVEEVVNQVRPDYIFHLAAQSSVDVSWGDPEETLKTNVLGTFYLLESIRETGLHPIIVIVGSSSIYGPRDEEDMPLDEGIGFQPTSIYGVSKASEDMLGFFYRKVYGMKIVRVRPFNMTGPGKTGDACADFSKGIVEIERGTRDVLEVGSLEAVRDFTDGRDVVNALWLLAEKGEPGGVYNLCSGRGYKMATILKMFFSLAKSHIDFRVVPEKIRPFDDPVYIGDNSRLRRLGWRPQIPLETTLKDMLDYWRNKFTLEESRRTEKQATGSGRR